MEESNLNKEIILGVCALTFIVPVAFAEEYKFTNTLPDYLEIEQGDSIVVKNLTN